MKRAQAVRDTQLVEGFDTGSYTSTGGHKTVTVCEH